MRPVKLKEPTPLGDPIDVMDSDYGMVYTKVLYLASSFELLRSNFCWLGSSGASVFTDDGRFIGVLHGIKVGFYSSVGDAQLLNNMCLVRPLASITDKELYEALRDYDGGEARHITH